MTETAGPTIASIGPPTLLFGTTEAVSEVPLERLEEEMRSLTGHLAAATCAFLIMVGEYDARGGWESWEALSCAHWLNWRCGVSMVTAREQVRVARRLRELPLIRAEFADGRISYSKVRAITRVAHPAIEARLIELAHDSTAAQLDNACAQLRRAHDQDRADADLAEAEERAQVCRSLRWHRDHETGDLVVQMRIPAGPDSDAFVARIDDQAVREPVEGDHLEPLECRRLDALLDLSSAGVIVESSLAPQPEVVIHLTPSTAAAACPVPNPSDDLTMPNAAGATDAPAESPAMLEPWPIRTTRGALLSTASLRQLACDAGFRTVVDHLTPRAGGITTTGWNPFDPPGLSSSDLGRHERFPNRALRRAVMRRDGGCCRFPSCTRRQRLHVHHITHWEHGGRTDEDNLLLLCPKHHRAVHQGGWNLTGDAANATFTRPDGPIADPASAPLHGTLAQLVHANQRHGRDIAIDGAGSQWLGDHIDWGCFFAAFNSGPHALPLEHVGRTSGDTSSG